MLSSVAVFTTASIWAITSTVSGNGDTGAGPNQFVVIADSLAKTSAASAADEKFRTLRTGRFGQVLRSVSFTPETDLSHPW